MHFHAEDGSPAGSKRLGGRLAARDANVLALASRPKIACNLLIIIDMTDTSQSLLRGRTDYDARSGNLMHEPGRPPGSQSNTTVLRSP